MHVKPKPIETYVNVTSWQVLLLYSRVVSWVFACFVTFGVLTTTAAVAAATTSAATITRTFAAKLRKFHRLASNGGRRGHSLCVCKESLEHGGFNVESSAAASVDHMERLINTARAVLSITWFDTGAGMVCGAARALTSQSACAAGARERGKGTEGWYHGSRTGNFQEE